MDQKSALDAGKSTLNLVLSFFPRVDAKASAVFAIDTGMLGYLAAHIPPLASLRWWEFPVPLAAFVLTGLSLKHLYGVAFPNLKGGSGSLIYFSEISKRREAKFVDEFLAQSEPEHLKDVLGQTWRNSEILAEKFRDLNWAFIFMISSIPPWVMALAEFSVRVRTTSPTN